MIIMLGLWLSCWAYDYWCFMLSLKIFFQKLMWN